MSHGITLKSKSEKPTINNYKIILFKVEKKRRGKAVRHKNLLTSSFYNLFLKEQLNKKTKTMEGEYTIKAIPTKNKTWRKADDVEIIISLDVGNETKTFKGIATLTGISKK